MGPSDSKTKRIAPEAYDALIDALSLVYWNKQPFERFLRLSLEGHPELLGRLSFELPKRQVAAELVMVLAQREDQYQDLTLSLMLQLSGMEDFPNLLVQTDREDLVERATAAVARLRKWTTRYGEIADEHERLRAEQERQRAASEQRRSLARLLADLETRFLALHGERDRQKRGLALQDLLNELFCAVDLNPRKAFTLQDEQIDGAFTFNTDDYLLEAKWEGSPAAREDVDVLAQKVQRKGKNTLGLFVAISGFSAPAVRAHSNCGSGLVFMDATDLLAVLRGWISLSELLEAKRRHLSETGHPLLPAGKLLR